MKKLFLLTLLAVLAVPVSRAQDSPQDGAPYRSLQGEVVDAATGEPLIFASLSLQGENISTVTNADGGFLLKVRQTWRRVPLW